ncbi:MAG: FAA hydrolase family protein [Frankiales bacterium]|nr:FAA hydrolase family protein [Frankiales bacterium]
MELLRLGPAGSERPAARVGGTLYDLSTLTDDIDGPFLADHGIARARDAVAAGALAVMDDPGDGSGLRVGPPVVRPGSLVCVGMNYRAHAAETGATPPEVPVIFFKAPNTLVGPYDDVRIPRGSTETDWEVELAFVVGSRARYLDSPDAALSCIAGLAVANDVSERAFQLRESGGQWSKGKSCETFNPLGPWLVPIDEIEDPSALRLRSFVNGEARQDSSTADMIFDVPFLLWHISQYMVLEPGDIVSTGTPEGVALSGRFPYLRPGDVMELSIDGLGAQRQTCRTWDWDAAAPGATPPGP